MHLQFAEELWYQSGISTRCIWLFVILSDLKKCNCKELPICFSNSVCIHCWRHCRTKKWIALCNNLRLAGCCWEWWRVDFFSFFFVLSIQVPKLPNTADELRKRTASLSKLLAAWRPSPGAGLLGNWFWETFWHKIWSIAGLARNDWLNEPSQGQSYQ